MRRADALCSVGPPHIAPTPPTLPMNPNIACYLPEQARARPHQIAVVKGSLRTGIEQLTFAELERKSDALAWGLAGYGIERGTRTLLMVPAGLPLLTLTFALFKVGAVPILIDPAMGRQNLAQCIAECAPEAMIGVAHAHVLRLIAPQSFSTTKRFVVAGSGWLGNAPTLDTLETVGNSVRSAYPIAEVRSNDMAAIAFTTGSTGVPKGVVYEYGMFQAQCTVLREFYQIAPGEIEMPAFPLFALFNVALGVTSAIPPIDPTKPAACDPAEVVAFMQEHHVTSTFGSPAIWNKVTAYCLKHGVRLPTLRRVLMAGAPVPQVLHERFLHILPAAGNTHTPYGATEALPIASISGNDVIAAHAESADPTAGTCVGAAVTGATLRIIAIDDAPIATWAEATVLAPYQVGEIAVCGPMVTKTYINRPESTALAKIADGDRFWHRMGDLGYLDDAGRLWFYGRKTHRVETADGPLYTEPVELVFNQHPLVARSALVGVRGQRSRVGVQRQAFNNQGKRPVQMPVVIIEPVAGHFPQTALARAQFCRELRILAEQYPMTRNLNDIRFHRAFPVDIRHNAKIFREKLAVWAEQHDIIN